jgi:hypothetical protein
MRKYFMGVFFHNHYLITNTRRKGIVDEIKFMEQLDEDEKVVKTLYINLFFIHENLLN